MPRIGDDKTAESAQRLSSNATKNAWMQTNEDMDALADQRRADGWEAVSIPAVSTAPMSQEAGTDDRFGITHIIPDNYADEFTAAFEEDAFPQYEAYRNEMDGRVFLVTELLDPDTKTAILIAGQYELQHAAGMASDAESAGHLFTHVDTLDGTVLGSFKHADFEPLIPATVRSND